MIVGRLEWVGDGKRKRERERKKRKTRKKKKREKKADPRQGSHSPPRLHASRGPQAPPAPGSPSERTYVAPRGFCSGGDWRAGSPSFYCRVTPRRRRAGG